MNFPHCSNRRVLGMHEKDGCFADPTLEREKEISPAAQRVFASATDAGGKRLRNEEYYGKAW